MPHVCLRGPYKPLLFITASWWSSSVVMICYSDALMPFSSTICSVKMGSDYLFSDEGKMVHSHVVSSWLVCCWSQSQAFIGSPSSLLLCHLFLGWGGHRLCVNLPMHRPRNVRLCCCLSPSIVLGHCQREGIKIRMKQRSWWGYIQFVWECKKKQLNRVPNYILNEAHIEWSPGIQRPPGTIQTYRKRTK